MSGDVTTSTAPQKVQISSVTVRNALDSVSASLIMIRCWVLLTKTARVVMIRIVTSGANFVARMTVTTSRKATTSQQQVAEGVGERLKKQYVNIVLMINYLPFLHLSRENLLLLLLLLLVII